MDCFVFDHQDLYTTLGMAVRNLKLAEDVAVESHRDRLAELENVFQSELGKSSAEAHALAASLCSLSYELQHLRRSTITEMLGYFEFFLRQLHIRTRASLSEREIAPWKFAKISEAKSQFGKDFALVKPFESKQWMLIEVVAKSRNCIVHAAGFVDRDFDHDERSLLSSMGVSLEPARTRVRGSRATNGLETISVSRHAVEVLQYKVNEFCGALMLSLDEPQSSVWVEPQDNMIDHKFRDEFSDTLKGLH